MPLDESTKKLLADSGFTQDADGKYNYSGGKSSGGGGKGNGGGGGGGSRGSLVPTINDQRNYLQTLISGTDYGNQEWAKQQLANLSGADGGYALSSLLPKPATSPLSPPSKLGSVPNFNYRQKPFEYTPPDYSITSDPANTTFVPTARAKDRWLQQEQLNADNAYKQFGSQFGKYQQLYKQQQDALANALEQQKMEQQIIAQQAAAAIQEANSKREDRRLELDELMTNYQINKPYYNPNAGGSIPKPTAADKALGWIQANMINFNSPGDMQAYLMSAMQNGEVGATWGNSIASELKKLYPDAF